MGKCIQLTGDPKKDRELLKGKVFPVFPPCKPPDYAAIEKKHLASALKFGIINKKDIDLIRSMKKRGYKFEYEWNIPSQRNLEEEFELIFSKIKTKK